MPIPRWKGFRLRRWAREAAAGFFLALVSALLALGAAETVFRIKGSGEPSRWYAIRTEAGQPVVETIRYEPTPRLPFRLAPVSFTIRKPPGGLRVFCLGDSTVFGYPYAPRGSPSKVLESILSAALPGRPVEVINAGYLGADSARVLSLLRELVEYQPDAFVVYVGHNEFLRYDYAHQVDVHFRFHPRVALSPRTLAFVALHESALWRWACGTDLGLALRGWWQQRRTGQRIGRSGQVSGKMMEATFLSYEENLAEMAGLCRQRRVPLVLCTVAGSAKSQSPLLRLHSRDGSPGAVAESQKSEDAAQRALDGGRPAEALPLAQRAEAFDPADALPDYLSGRARLALKDVDGARACFEAAIEKDGLRHRAFARISEEVRRVAREKGAALCDIRALFEARCADGIIGDELIVDHVHPNLEGMVLLARAMARGLADAGVAPADAVEKVPLSDEDLIARLSMDRPATRDAMLRLALSAAGQENPARAASLFLIAATLYEPGESDVALGPDFLRGVAALLQGDMAKAKQVLGGVRSRDPELFERMSSRFAQLRISERIR
ncbi:MAG: hypothetical protein DMF49_11455 [Acidobacteria bacterium]|nr:MAG: hypothetical protein DMF49_11455 [Acidobacteriota bacterium]